MGSHNDFSERSSSPGVYEPSKFVLPVRQKRVRRKGESEFQFAVEPVGKPVFLKTELCEGTCKKPLRLLHSGMLRCETLFCSRFFTPVTRNSVPIAHPFPTVESILGEE